RLTAKASGAEVELELRELTPEVQRRQPRWADRASSGEAVAFAVPFEALGHDPGETVEMVAVAHEKAKPVEQIPPTGSIRVRVPGDVFRGRQNQPLKILLVAAEVAPFAKVGGLADVAGALPKALKAMGHDVRVVMPRYGSIDVEKYGFRRIVTNLAMQRAHTPVNADVLEGRIAGVVQSYFIDNQSLFGR